MRRRGMMGRSVLPMLFLLVVLVASTGMAEDADEADRPGWLGCGIVYREEVDPETGESRGFFRVQGVDPGGPAESAGLAAGDIVNEIDGEPFHFAGNVAVLTFFAEIEPEDSIELGVLRGTETVTVTVTAARMPDEKYERWKTVWATAQRMAAAEKADH